MNSAQEPRRPGRPKGTTTGRTVKPIHVTLEPHLADWAREQPGGISQTVRKCLERMRAADREKLARGEG